MAERWNGTAWSIQPTPNPTGSDFPWLNAVSCPSATACTAVGYNEASGTPQTLAERWNGTKWSIEPTPNPIGSSSAQLHGVSCLTAPACTAVGYAGYGQETDKTLAERYLG